MSAKEKYMTLKNKDSTREEWLSFIQEFSIQPYSLVYGIPNREPGKYSKDFSTPVIQHPSCSACHHTKEDTVKVCKNKSDVCIVGNYVTDIPDTLYVSSLYNTDFEITTGY